MSDLGIVESDLGGLSQEKDKPLFKRIFREVMKLTSFGPVDAEAGKRATTNFRGHLYGPITTPGVANVEFSVLHEFMTAPYLILPVLAPDQVNSKLVRLTVSRAADARRVYLSSPDTSAVLFLYIEG